ncbi:MAG: GNAT family N-acetyltransferase [Rhizobiaceae bacterium]|nr:GNAT family N-acetyltransferase [Rhizobiaceae bacterium]
MQPEVHQNAGVIRQLRPSDLPRFRAHLLRLDSESRHDRFNGAISDAFIDRYADRSFHEGATVIGYLEGEQVLGAAELHERTDLPEPTGEIAFSVERHRQRQGIGAKLFHRLLAHAHALGYQRLHVTTHSDNRAMKALAKRFGAELSFGVGETVGTITLDPNGWPDGFLLEPGPDLFSVTHL